MERTSYLARRRAESAAVRSSAALHHPRAQRAASSADGSAHAADAPSRCPCGCSRLRHPLRLLHPTWGASRPTSSASPRPLARRPKQWQRRRWWCQRREQPCDHREPGRCSELATYSASAIAPDARPPCRRRTFRPSRTQAISPYEARRFDHIGCKPATCVDFPLESACRR